MRQSLRHSCRTELTRQWISLPSDRQGYSRRLLGLISTSYTCNILSCSTGQASDSIHHFSISQSPVFLVNSRHLLFFDTATFVKPLSPKLFICRFIHKLKLGGKRFKYTLHCVSLKIEVSTERTQHKNIKIKRSHASYLPSLFRSYRVNLPSSFNYIIPSP